MKLFVNQALGIDQGDIVLFSDYQDGGDMWTGSGSRVRHRRLQFSKPFKQPPIVHVSLSMWDMDSRKNARADVDAEKIDEKGFDVVFRTWGDTRVARARIRWMAIGPVAHEDDWELY